MTQKFYVKNSSDEYEEVKAFKKEDIDQIVGDSKWFTERLERERGKFADYDELKSKAEKLEAASSEYESKIADLSEQQKGYDAKIKEAVARADKIEAISKYNLSDELAEFVTGDTKEEMLKRAEKLSKNTSSGAAISKKEVGEPDETPFHKMRRELLGDSDD